MLNGEVLGRLRDAPDPPKWDLNRRTQETLSPVYLMFLCLNCERKLAQKCNKEETHDLCDLRKDVSTFKAASAT